MYKFLCECTFPFLSGSYLGVELCCVAVTLCPTIWRNARLFSSAAVPFTFVFKYRFCYYLCTVRPTIQERLPLKRQLVILTDLKVGGHATSWGEPHGESTSFGQEPERRRKCVPESFRSFREKEQVKQGQQDEARLVGMISVASGSSGCPWFSGPWPWVIRAGGE